MLEWVLQDWTNGISKTKGAKQTMKIYMNQHENHQPIECSPDMLTFDIGFLNPWVKGWSIFRTLGKLEV